MATKVIPLSELQANAERHLRRCSESDAVLVVQLPGRGKVRIERFDASDDLIDDLIANNSAFQDELRQSAAGPRKPFPLPRPKSARKKKR